MPRGDFYGSRNFGLPPRTRLSPSKAVAVLDKGLNLQAGAERSLAQTCTPQEASRSRGRSVVRHIDFDTPMGYSHAYEAHISYVKDGWCQPACNCLHLAASSGDLGKLKAAMEGASPYTRKHNINSGDEIGRTPIMVAAWRGEVAALKLLTDAGADLLLQDNDGRTVLHWALCTSSATLEMLQALTKKNVDPLLKDRHGDTVLHKCVPKNQWKAAELLCKTYPRLCITTDKHKRTAQDLVDPKHERMHKAVDVQAALEFVEREQAKMMAEAMAEHEREMKEKIAKQLVDKDLEARKRRDEVIKRSAMQGGLLMGGKEASASFDKLSEEEHAEGGSGDDYSVCEEKPGEAALDLGELEKVSFFTSLTDWEEPEVQTVNAEEAEAIKAAAAAAAKHRTLRRTSISTFSTEKKGRRRAVANTSLSPQMIAQLAENVKG